MTAKRALNYDTPAFSYRMMDPTKDTKASEHDELSSYWITAGSDSHIAMKGGISVRSWTYCLKFIVDCRCQEPSCVDGYKQTCFEPVCDVRAVQNVDKKGERSDFLLLNRYRPFQMILEGVRYLQNPNARLYM
jgi:hypothetical protein